jgi:hypothetical protein
MADKGEIVPLSRFHALLGRLRGAKRVDAIVSRKDAAQLVAELPVQDLFFLIKETGLDDCRELVELATPEQFQGFLDLDCWAVDRLRDDATRPWLFALLDAGYEKTGQVWRALDPELTALILQRWTRIYNLAEQDVPEDEEPPFYPTPDRFFMVKITAEDGETVRLVERLLDALYRDDPVQARHTLRAAMSEPPGELEEMSHRWRAGRMQDLGYADYYEALEVYRPIDPASVKPGEGTADRPPESHLPAPLADPALKRGFLGEVLLAIDDPAEARRLESALVALLNRVLSADRVEPGDLVALAPAASRAAGTLSIGLETVARGDRARGIEVLRSVALARLHRVGHAVLLQLARLAATLGPRATRAEEPYVTIAAALRSERPVYSRLLDDQPEPGTRPFASLADVRRAASSLARLAAQVVLVHELCKADPVALGPAVTLGDVGRTAIVHAGLGHPVGELARPLTPQQVRDYAQGPAHPPKQRLLELAAAEKIPLPQESSEVIDGWLDDMVRGIGRTAVLLEQFQ